MDETPGVEYSYKLVIGGLLQAFSAQAGEFQYRTAASPTGVGGVWFRSIDEITEGGTSQGPYEVGPVFQNGRFVGLSRSSGFDDVLDDIRILPNPLPAVGSTWSLSAIVENSVHWRQSFSGTATLGNFESISVEAGNFAGCARVDVQGTYTIDYDIDGEIDESYSGSVSVWLAPGIGIVKASYKVAGMEIVALELSRRQPLLP